MRSFIVDFNQNGNYDPKNSNLAYTKVRLKVTASDQYTQSRQVPIFVMTRHNFAINTMEGYVGQGKRSADMTNRTKVGNI